MPSNFDRRTDGLNNLKYLTRSYTYGKLKDIEYVNEAMVLVFESYVACEYFGGTTPIRVYVPTVLEDKLRQTLICGDCYFIVTAPYRISFRKKYQHRVELLLNIFQEII